MNPYGTFENLQAKFERLRATIRERRRKRNPIYIVPTRYGIWLGITLLFMVLAGAVYSNNLVLIIAFMAVTLGIAAMLETHTRVLKIKVASVSANSGYADEPVTIRVLLESSSTKDLPGISIQVLNPYAMIRRDSYCDPFTIQAKTSLSVIVRGSSWPRGRHYVKLVRVITSNRMGLFTAWREFPVAATFKRYPARLKLPVPATRGWSDDGSSGGNQGFDFAGHRSFREGDDIRRLDWKLLARHHTKEIKVFTEGGRPREVLNWNDFPTSLGFEEKLSITAGWVDACEKERLSVQFNAPFCPQGAEDYNTVLSALARVPSQEHDVRGELSKKLNLFKRIILSRPVRLMTDMTLSPVSPKSKPNIPRWQLLALTLFSSVCILQVSPRWLSLLSLFLAGFWCVSHWRRWSIPPTWVKGLAIAVCGFFTFFEFHQLFGPEAGTCLLTLFTFMKFFEVESYRDSQHTLILCLVMIASGALLNPNMITTIQAVLGVWLVGHFFLKMHEPEMGAAKSLRDSFVLLVTALPLSAALFFFFPRLSFQIFRPSGMSEQVRTGFSESLDPGSISELVQSDDLQFRAYLDHAIGQRDLYWRGEVLHTQNGMQWRKGIFHVAAVSEEHPDATPRKHEKATAPPASIVPIPYRIILQPHSQTSLFALDRTILLRSGTPESHLQPVAKPDDVFEWPKQITSQLIYKGRSILGGQLSSRHETGFLSAPTEEDRAFHPETDARFLSWITEMKNLRAEKHWNARQVARQVLVYYRDHDFHYTLEPGINPNPSVSSFLFDWKRGFCEHFAGATATILRALDVPAHVVIGYQGGEWNSASNHYVVTSRDAHAWLEAWDGESWFRVDPVEVLTPLRLDVGGRAFMDMLKSGWQGKLDLVGYQNWFNSQTPVQKMMRGVQAWTESISSRWNLFLLTFNYETQLEGLRALGLKTASRLFLFLGVSIICVALFVLMAIWVRRSPSNRLERRFKKLVRRLEHAAGLDLGQNGPLEIEVHVGQLPRDDQHSARTFLDHYRRTKYGGVSSTTRKTGR